MQFFNKLSLILAFIFTFSIYAMDITPNLGKHFNDFKIKSIDGEQLDTAKLRNNKILVVKFGTTWCPPCNMQTGHFKTLYENYDKKDVVILEVFAGESEELAKNYRDKKQFKYYAAADPDGSISRTFSVSFVPKVMIVDKNGIIKYEGAMTPYEQLKAEIDKLLHPETANKFKDFKLNDVNGNEVDTKILRQGKVLVVKFGATWCPPCNREIAQLKKVVENYSSDKVVVLDVNTNEKLEKIKKHRQEKGINYLTVIDNTGRVMQMYSVKYIPKVIIVDKNGNIVYNEGYTEYDKFKEVIDPLLK